MTTVSELSAIARGIEAMESEWRQQRPSKSAISSVFGLWREGIQMRKFCQDKWNSLLREYGEMIQSNKYSPEYLNKQRRQMEDDYRTAAENIEESYRKDVESFITRKTELLDQMLVTAPSEEQRNLLTALQMRGSHVTRGELMRIAPIFYSNYNAMMAFSQICDSTGYSVHLPLENAMELYDDLDNLRNYFTQASHQIGRTDKPDMAWRAFFYADPESENITADANITSFAQRFDSISQLQDKTADVLTYGEQARIKELFKGLDRLNPQKPADLLKIVDKTKTIINDNPKDLELIMRTDYYKYAEMVVAVEKAKMDSKTVSDAAAGAGTSE